MSLSKNIIDRYENLFLPTNSDWLYCDHIYEPNTRCRCIDRVELNIAILLVKKLSEENTLHKINFPLNNPYIVELCDEDEDRKIIFNNLCQHCDSIEILKHDRKSQENFIPKEERINIISSKKNLLILFSAFCLLNANSNEKDNKRNEIIKTYFCVDTDAFVEYIKEFKQFISNFSKWENKLDFFKNHLQLICDVLELHAKENCNELIENILTVLKNPIFKQNYLYNDGTYEIKNCLERSISIVQSRKMQKLDIVLYDRSIVISYIIDIIKILNNNYGKSAFIEITKQIYSNFNEIVLNQKRQEEERIIEKLNDLALLQM